MPFTNEEVSPQDIETYELRRINKMYAMVDDTFYWTVDRHRGVYLRYMGNDWRQPSHARMTFHWKGHLMHYIFVRSTSTTSLHRTTGDTIWSLKPHQQTQGLFIPKELSTLRDFIYHDLKDALRAYREAGYFSTLRVHTATFEF